MGDGAPPPALSASNCYLGCWILRRQPRRKAAGRAMAAALRPSHAASQREPAQQVGCTVVSRVLGQNKAYAEWSVMQPSNGCIGSAAGCVRNFWKAHGTMGSPQQSDEGQVERLGVAHLLLAQTKFHCGEVVIRPEASGRAIAALTRASHRRCSRHRDQLSFQFRLRNCDQRGGMKMTLPPLTHVWAFILRRRRI